MTARAGSLAARHGSDESIHLLRKEISDRLAAGQRFAGLVGTATEQGLRLTALMARRGGIDTIDADLPSAASAYPALSAHIAAARWYEREIHDLFGVVPLGHPRLDPLILPLPADEPRRPRPGGPPAPDRLPPTEPSLPRHVGGGGMFTIPHGPVRSGVFESVEYVVETPGEDIPHVRVRVFAKHRGLEKRFESMTVAEGVLLAERVEGIASVAHALAYCHAVERLAEVGVPAASRLVRVLHAELERVANHLDVAIKLADAAGLAVAVARFGWHKERTLRLVGELCGSRFGRGVVVPGGVQALPRLGRDDVVQRVARLHKDIRADERELMGTSSFLDRLRTTGPLSPEVAHERGALGPIGQASGLDDDARRHRPYDGYDQLQLRLGRRYEHGDAQDRLRVRWDEVRESFGLVRQALDALAGQPEQALIAEVEPADGRAVGWAEAPQGEVVYLVEVEGGRIRRCKPRSASFHNLVLFHDVFAGDIFTDFPFIEASFGLSIAGVVL